MSGGRQCGVAAVAWLMAAPSLAAKPTVLALATPDYNESLIERPTVVGNLLVGLHWRVSDRPFDPANVAVQPAPNGQPGLVCASVASEDGRYSSTNLFRIPAGIAAPATLENKSRAWLNGLLAGYDVSRIGVVVREAISCDDPSPGAVLPVTLLPQDKTAPALVAKINATAADVSIAMVGPTGETLTKSSCKPAPEGVRIAFGAECVIELKPGHALGKYTLTVKVQESFTTDTVSFPLLILQ